MTNAVVDEIVVLSCPALDFGFEVLNLLQCLFVYNAVVVGCSSYPCDIAGPPPYIVRLSLFLHECGDAYLADFIRRLSRWI